MVKELDLRPNTEKCAGSNPAAPNFFTNLYKIDDIWYLYNINSTLKIDKKDRLRWDLNPRVQSTWD